VGSKGNDHSSYLKDEVIDVVPLAVLVVGLLIFRKLMLMQQTR